MRMEPLNRPTANALQERTCRTWRPAFHMLSWHIIGRYTKANDKYNAVVASLSQDQLNRNTTRGSTPGLVNPEYGEAGGRVPLPKMKLGAGLSRLQTKRLRDEQKLKELQDVGINKSSEERSEDPSEEVEDLDATPGRPGGLARTIAEFCHDNAIGMSLPGMPNSRGFTKRAYSSRRPSAPSSFGNVSTQAPPMRKFAVADTNNQNSFVDAYTFNLTARTNNQNSLLKAYTSHPTARTNSQDSFLGAYTSKSAVYTSAMKRLRENEVQGTEQERGAIAKRRRAAAGRSPDTSVVPRSTVPQPRVTTFPEPWVPPSRSQPCVTSISSPSRPHPPASGRFLSAFPAYVTPAARMIAEPGRMEEPLQPYNYSLEDDVVSSGVINGSVTSGRNNEGNVIMYDNRLEGFRQTQGYQGTWQAFPRADRIQNFADSAIEEHVRANSSEISPQELSVSQDLWTVNPAVNYDLLAQQGWDDLHEAIKARYGSDVSPDNALHR